MYEYAIKILREEIRNKSALIEMNKNLQNVRVAQAHLADVKELDQAIEILKKAGEE